MEAALRYIETIDADPVTKDIVKRWEDVLDRLAEDPMQCSREIDWVIKKEMIETYMVKHRFSWRDPKVSLMDLQYQWFLLYRLPL